VSSHNRPASGRFQFVRRSAGFTMVELIIVMLLIGILGAIGAGRFFKRTGFDAAAFAEQSAAMLRYAQKLAIAQNRPVYVQVSAQGLQLCYKNAAAGACTDRVDAPSGSNSGSTATRSFCTAGGAYVSSWNCEAPPAGVTITLSSAAAGSFYFNGLGRPYANLDTGDSSFTGLSLTVKGDDLTRSIAIERETGYVY
jgi:MSHA pilin protein MshC